MANSTTEYWDIDGTSLHQYGWAVSTVGGARYDLPVRRGDNRVFAYRPGAVHRPKLPQHRVIDLAMWLTGTDPATGATVSDPRMRWNDSWDFLRRLVWKPNGAQVTLTRRWWLTVGSTATLVTADAKAEIVDTMAPTMTGRHRATFTMSLLMADPYFYGPEITVNLVKDVPISINNPGHDVAGFGHMELDIIGSLTGPRVTNATPSPDVRVWYDPALTIAGGKTLRLDVPAFQATRLPEGANVIGDVRHGGARTWMSLLPGANLLTLTASAGSGSAQLRFRPPYI